MHDAGFESPSMADRLTQQSMIVREAVKVRIFIEKKGDWPIICIKS